MKKNKKSEVVKFLFDDRNHYVFKDSNGHAIVDGYDIMSCQKPLRQAAEIALKSAK